MRQTEDQRCAECGLWIDPKWRACPTCGTRLAHADRSDRTERIAGVAVVLGGVLMAVGAVLPWSRVTAASVTTETRWGMSGGRGIIAILFALVAIVLGGLVLVGRRVRGNRWSLFVIGLLALVFAFLQRSLIVKHVDDLRFQAGTVRATTAAQLASNRPTNHYGIGLLLIAVAGVCVAIAGMALPRQIAPRGLPARAEPAAPSDQEEVSVP